MSYSLNSLMGGYIGVYIGTTIGVTKRNSSGAEACELRFRVLGFAFSLLTGFCALTP